MKRQKIGGAVMNCSDLKKVMNEKANYAGIIFSIPKPKGASGVGLEVYGAEIGSNGLQKGKKFKCTLRSCSIKKGSTSTNVSKFEFEHCDQFSLFDPEEPFIAYFSRSQLEMLLSLGKFDKVYLGSFMPLSSNPMVNEEELIPNFSLEMQPYTFPKMKKRKTKSNTKNTTTSYGLPGTIRAAGCPRTWRKE